MRVLFFLGGSYVSGLEVVNLHLINELLEMGVEVHCIINGWNNGDIKNRLQASKISFTEVKLGGFHLSKPQWTIDTLVHLPGARKKIKEVIRLWDPNIIHFCSYANIITLYDMINRPAIFNLQEPHEPSLKHKLIYRLVDKRVKKFTTVSNDTKEKMVALSIPAQRIQVIQNGIPAQQPPQPSKTGEKLVIGIIGQVMPWKGHETLLRAVHQLVTGDITEFKVCIFGNDETDYAAELKKEIKRLDLTAYFSWEGFQKQQACIYQTVHCVVVPSLSEEPCSLTIIEAMWNGKAVIASDRGGNTELIDHEKNGLVFKANDHADLAHKINYLLGSTQAISVLGREAYAKASSRLTAKQMGAAYLDLYTTALNGEERHETH